MLMQQIIETQFSSDANPETIADVFLQQLAAVHDLPFSSRASMLLNDSFTLGYLAGFARQASRYAGNTDGAHEDVFYLREVFRNILENPDSAPAYVTLSQSQENNAKFRHGAEIGETDLNDWFLSLGRFLPVNLAEYLRYRREVKATR